jgi:hypothetical protein
VTGSEQILEHRIIPVHEYTPNGNKPPIPNGSSTHFELDTLKFPKKKCEKKKRNKEVRRAKKLAENRYIFSDHHVVPNINCLYKEYPCLTVSELSKVRKCDAIIYKDEQPKYSSKKFAKKLYKVGSNKGKSSCFVSNKKNHQLWFARQEIVDCFKCLN